MSEWIRVEDELPEEDENVLFYVASREAGGDPFIVKGHYWWEKWHSDNEFEGDSHFSGWNVTHWMPLPEPPEVQQP